MIFMDRYERFKLEWMIQHGFTLTDLMNCMEAMLEEDLDGSDVHTDLKCLFADWEYGIGFEGGQIWPSKEEFESNEGADSEGVCPVCGGQINYGCFELVDEGGTYDWECPDCGATGKEGYDLTFDGSHYDVMLADGTPFEEDDE